MVVMLVNMPENLSPTIFGQRNGVGHFLKRRIGPEMPIVPVNLAEAASNRR
jgi:hypothetical protein